LGFKKWDTPKIKAFFKKKCPKKRDIKDFRRDILQKSGTFPLKSAQMDSLI
jgi:ribosomal protein S30